jgi:hypothetical protein
VSSREDAGAIIDGHEVGERLQLGSTGRNPVDIAKRVADHLVAKNDPPVLFRMGEQGDVARTEDEGSISPLDSDEWLCHVAEMVDFHTTTKEGTVKPVGPPQQVMRMVPAAVKKRLPVLDGIASTPYLTAAGDVIAADGYNPESRLLLRTGGLVLPPVPEEPTRAEVRAAVSLLTEDWLGDFPFETTADRATAVALVLTLTGRVFTGLAPLFVIDASTPGSGKGLLVTTTNIIATGEPPHLLELPQEGEEQRKKITSALLAGNDLIVWDETHTIAGRTLAMILTADVYSDRVLGGNKIVAIRNRFTQVAIGNNVQVFGDLKRRVAPVRLVPAVEHPEARQDFRHANLAQWTHANRGDLLAATLTLLRAWIAAGKPRSDVTMGSFEKWAAVIGGVLDVAGIPGFMTGTSAWLDESDPDTDGWSVHLAALHTLSAGQPFTVAQVVRWLGRLDHNGERMLELPYYRRDADPNQGREIGNMYRRQRDRWHGGYCLQSSKARNSSTGGKTWVIIKPGDSRTEVAVLDSVRLSDSVEPGQYGRATESTESTESPTLGSQQESTQGAGWSSGRLPAQPDTQRNGFGGVRA